MILLFIKFYLKIIFVANVLLLKRSIAAVIRAREYYNIMLNLLDLFIIFRVINCATAMEIMVFSCKAELWFFPLSTLRGISEDQRKNP